MADNNLRDRLEDIFSGLEDPPDDLFEPLFDREPTPPSTGRPRRSPAAQPYLPPEPAVLARPTRPRPTVQWRLIIWAVLLSLAALLLLAYSQAIFNYDPSSAAVGVTPRFIIPATPTTTPTPRFSPTPRLDDRGPVLSFQDATVTPTAVPGGRGLALNPAALDAGWAVSNDDALLSEFDAPNHLGDSYLYSGALDGQQYVAVLQFDLRRIPRGTQVTGASLRLTGLRADQLQSEGRWQVELLAPEIDLGWRGHSYGQFSRATALSVLSPELTPAELGQDVVNSFEFSAEQLALLTERILNGSDKFGRFVSFRIVGPGGSQNNLFAWDSGVGPASAKQPPQLFLNLGPAPAETPPPYFVLVTSTPTPQTIETAVAHSVQMTAAARRDGTATAVPPYWVTPVVVTATPTGENAATAVAQAAQATAIAMTTGQPPHVVTATPTPTYVIITSTPTPENVMTAAAQAAQVTAAAMAHGTATPLPANWVTPAVVINPATPENTATVQYWQAVAMTTGTPTPTPANVQTATPTPVLLYGLPSPTATATPTSTPQSLPALLLGRIIFLSDREGATVEERTRAEKLQATPQITPQPYVFDPATGQVARLTDRWPYDSAVKRDAWTLDGRFEAYNQELLWVTSGPRIALHVYDHEYNVERLASNFGVGIVYDPVWSPSRPELVFVSTETGNDDVWTSNADGSEPHQLTHNDWAWDKHPSFAPDGEQIVFYSNRTGTNQLWLMNRDGSGQRLLLPPSEFNDFDPVWVKTLAPPPELERLPDWRFVKPTAEP